MTMLMKDEGCHDGSYFYHIGDGLHYHVNVVAENAVYLKCIHYEQGCWGRAVLRSSGVFEHTQTHSHSPDPLYPEEMAVRRRILQRSSTREYMSFRDIINHERIHANPNVAARMTSRRLRSQMYRRRMEHFPPVPQSVQELSLILQDPSNVSISSTIDDSDNLYGSYVTDSEEKDHIIFVSRRMLSFMTMCCVLFSDGTFKATPSIPGLYQVFCITTIWRYHVLPMAWILMSSKNTAAYIAVLNRLKNLMGHHRLQTVITDFETAEQNAWRLVFQVPVQGCLFHYCSALLKYAFGLGLKMALQTYVHMKAIVSWCCALPLLPQEYIDIGFYVIGQDTRAYYPGLYPLLRDFFIYVNDTWIIDQSRRTSLSVSGSANRTNNACETSNRWLMQELKVPHSSSYRFLNSIARIEQATYVDILTLSMGDNPSRRRKAVYVAGDAAVQSLTEDLYNSPDGVLMAVRRFLHGASFRIIGLIDRTVCDIDNNAQRINV